MYEANADRERHSIIAHTRDTAAKKHHRKEGNGGPLLWWNLNASQFPVLSKMAADFLAV